MFSYEQELLSKGIRLVAGIDEVGRGCLAGPMTIGCVVYDLAKIIELKSEAEGSWINDIKDSKKLTPKKRGFLAEEIKNNATSYSLFCISNEQIDTNGISWAERFGFAQAVKEAGSFDFALTDAFPIPTLMKSKQINITGGDNKSVTIASASILAKVFRDNLMIEQSKLYPQYFFDKHKGYGTKLHIEMIKEYGICDLHRKSFEPIKSFINQQVVGKKKACVSTGLSLIA
jgi:ribonuclease HII